MSLLERNVNIGAVVLPAVAFVVAIALLWDTAVNTVDLTVLLVYWAMTGFGITVGYHRLLTHRSFEVHRVTRYVFAILGSLAIQGNVAAWVADHRKHHANTDREGDPHSPHTHDSKGALGALRGLWYAHTGWLFDTHGQADLRRYAPDILDDPGLKTIARLFPYIAVGGLFLPAMINWLIFGTLQAALEGLLWGGLVRVFIIHHVTWSINSICHFFGSRRFDVDDKSTNVAWLAIPSLGEAWHHNHHAFPRSAQHGLRRREIDLSSWLIAGMEKLGLAWNVVRISPERQSERLSTEVSASRAA